MADRYQVVVHISDDGSCVEGGPRVTAETSRRIACDSTVVSIAEGAKCEPLSIGRRSRSIPPPMRRALAAIAMTCFVAKQRAAIGHQWIKECSNHFEIVEDAWTSAANRYRVSECLLA